MKYTHYQKVRNQNNVKVVDNQRGLITVVTLG
jgi:hypothetical protein